MFDAPDPAAAQSAAAAAAAAALERVIDDFIFICFFYWPYAVYENGFEPFGSTACPAIWRIN